MAVKVGCWVKPLKGEKAKVVHISSSTTYSRSIRYPESPACILVDEKDYPKWIESGGRAITLEFCENEHDLKVLKEGALEEEDKHRWQGKLM